MRDQLIIIIYFLYIYSKVVGRKFKSTNVSDNQKQSRGWVVKSVSDYTEEIYLKPVCCLNLKQPITGALAVHEPLSCASYRLTPNMLGRSLFFFAFGSSFMFAGRYLGECMGKLSKIVFGSNTQRFAQIPTSEHKWTAKKQRKKTNIVPDAREDLFAGDSVR